MFPIIWQREGIDKERECNSHHWAAKYYLGGGQKPSPEWFSFLIHTAPVSISPGPSWGCDCDRCCVNEAPLEMKCSEAYSFLSPGLSYTDA